MKRKGVSRMKRDFSQWTTGLITGIMVYTGAASGAGVTVTSPAASDTLKLGLSHTIAWKNDTTPASSYAVIQLYRGAEYEQTIASSAYNNGTYLWTVPPTLDTAAAYRIKVLYSTNSNIFGYSASFKVKDSAGISVTAPAASDSFSVGISTYIRWQKAGAAAGSYFSIALYTGDSLVRSISTSYYGGYASNSYSWTVPYDLDTSKAYRIKIASVSQPSIAAFSGAFKVYDRWNVRVYEPKSADTLPAGSYNYIRWQSAETSGYVRLDLYRGDTLVSLITSSVYVPSAYYYWYMSAAIPPATGYKIKATNTNNSARYSFSDAFTIAPAPKITVTAPAANASFTYGDSTALQWKSEGKVGATVSIALYKGSYLQQTLSVSTSNSGAFSWIVPSNIIEGVDYKIRVTSGSVYGESGLFYVGPGSSKVIFLPDSGSVYTLGDYLPIGWRYLWFSASTYDYVEIGLYRGESLVTPIASNAYNSGKQSWNIIGTLTTSSDYRISIKSISNPAKSALSSPFTISTTPRITITTPVDSAVIEQGAYSYIYWQGKGQVGKVRFSYSPNNGQSWTMFDSSTLASGSVSWRAPAATVVTPVLLRAACAESADTVAITIGVRPRLLVPLSASDTDLRPRFVWSSIKKGEIYTLKIDSLGSFSSPYISIQVQDTTYTPAADLAPGRYYWRVEPSSLPQLYSASQYFTVPDPRVPRAIAVEPNPTTERRPPLRWHPVKGAKSYNLIVTSNSGFYNPLISIPLGDTAYKPTIDLPLGPIYWKVRSDLLDVYCSAQRFEIQSDSIPVLCRFNGAFAPSNKPVFKWYKAPGAASYRIEVYDSAGMKTGKVAIATHVSDTVFTPAVPLDGGLYYWRVCSSVKLTYYSAWDSVRVKPLIGVESAQGIPCCAGFLAKESGGCLVVKYGQPAPAAVEISVFTIGGKRVAQWSGIQGPGYYRWTPRTRLSARVYIVAATVGGKRFVQKVKVVP